MGYPTYDAADRRVAELEAELEESNRAYLALQQMLGFVLFKVGEPIVLTHKDVVEGLPEGATIFIDEDPGNLDHTIGITVMSVDE